MILLILGLHGVSALNFKVWNMLILKYVELESKIQLLFLWHNYNSLSYFWSNSHVLYVGLVLGVLCYGPVLFGTGPVTANTNPVTLYTYPVLTITVKYRRVYYRY
jgi:hypothetical protein